MKESEKNAAKSSATSSLTADISNLDNEIAQMKARLHKAQQEKQAIKQKKDELSSKIHQSKLMIEALTLNRNHLNIQHINIVEQISSINDNIDISVASFDRFKQINTINDAFYIWYTGPFATINAFKLGNLVNKPVESIEMNAGLGQAALVINLIANQCNIQFKSYYIIPMGSYPRIYRVEDRRTSYPLFIDQGSFQLFPKRNFNLALTGFMQCIYELGEYITLYDPTLSIPYKIDVNNSKIADKSYIYGGDEEIWTHSLKHMLANIKWIIAWYGKHGHY